MTFRLCEERREEMYIVIFVKLSRAGRPTGKITDNKYVNDKSRSCEAPPDLRKEPVTLNVSNTEARLETEYGMKKKVKEIDYIGRYFQGPQDD